LTLHSAYRILSPKTLRLTGSIYCTVAKASGLIPHIFSQGGFELLLAIVTDIPEESSNRQNKIEQLWRTLILDSAKPEVDVYPASPELGKSFYSFVLHGMSQALFYFCLQTYRILPKFSGSVGDEVCAASFLWRLSISYWPAFPLYDFFSHTAGLLPTRAEVEAQFTTYMRAYHQAAPLQFKPPAIETLNHYARIFIHTTGGRCLFITNDGRLGLAPSSTRAGDVVAFVRNARVPFVLRPAGDGRYYFVGEAYVRGLMHGEVGILELGNILLV